jgi:hypothetical protein
MPPWSPIRAFLLDIDQAWDRPAAARIPLQVIGSTALMLLAEYERGTKDSDILKATRLTEPIQQRLLELAGPGSRLHRKHRLYLDFVAPGITFLPRPPRFHPVPDLETALRHFDVQALDVVDTVVGKLKRFAANDLSDIQAMVDLDLVDHAQLLERFRSAVEGYSMDARAEDLRIYLRNLNRVERDFLGVKESRIDLPEWMDEV